MWIDWPHAGFINHLRLPGGIVRATNEVGFHWVSW
jgi:hypothetical protein